MKNTSSTFLTRVRMARILFLFSVCFLSLHSYAANIGAYAQQKNLTIEMRNKTVKEVLDYIEKNSEFIFFYYSKAIDTKRIVSLSVKDQPITVILDQLFKNTDVLYEIKDRQISLKREELPTEQRPQDSKQQKRKLVGTVTDASSSDPLVGKLFCTPKPQVPPLPFPKPAATASRYCSSCFPGLCGMLPISYTIIYRIASIISPSCKNATKIYIPIPAFCTKSKRSFQSRPPPRR